MLCGSLRHRMHTLLRDYVRLQYIVVVLIYAQIGCALIGSLGALYNGILLINLAIALFGLVAVESSSQSLGRTYAVLLFCAILLDISWLILFSKEIWNISSEMHQALYIFSVKLTMAMEIAGFVVRLSSSLLWLQIYRLGASFEETSLTRQPDSDLQNSFVEPPLLARQYTLSPGLQNSFLESSAIAKQDSRSGEILGDSMDEQAEYTPILNDGESNTTSPLTTQVTKHQTTGNMLEGSSAEASGNKSPLSSSSWGSLDSCLH